MRKVRSTQYPSSRNQDCSEKPLSKFLEEGTRTLSLSLSLSLSLCLSVVRPEKLQRKKSHLGMIRDGNDNSSCDFILKLFLGARSVHAVSWYPSTLYSGSTEIKLFFKMLNFLENHPFEMLKFKASS